MKKNILSVFLILGLLAPAFAIGEDEAKEPTKVVIPVDDNFCENLKKIIDAARQSFDPLRGEETTRLISGEERPFNVSTLTLEGAKCYINASEDAGYYPECECFVGENKFAPGPLSKKYEDVKAAVQKCMGDSFTFTEKDKTNDIYLEDTEFKKFLAIEKKDGAGKRLKFFVFLNNNRVLGHWTVEFHFDGLVQQ